VAWFQQLTGKLDAVAMYEVGCGCRVASTVGIGPRDQQDESDALEMFTLLLRDLKELIAGGVVR